MKKPYAVPIFYNDFNHDHDGHNMSYPYPLQKVGTQILKIQRENLKKW